LPPLLPVEPAGNEQGSVAASEKAGPARFPAAPHVIARVTDLRTLSRPIVPVLPGQIGYPALNLSHLRGGIDVWLGSQADVERHPLVSALKPKSRHHHDVRFVPLPLSAAAAVPSLHVTSVIFMVMRVGANEPSPAIRERIGNQSIDFFD
jgi:hypothetical protein